MNPRDEKPPGKAANVGDAKAGKADAEKLRSDLSFAAMTTAEQDQHQLKVAEYIQSMCVELRAMAQGAELDGLAYFIDMAKPRPRSRTGEARAIPTNSLIMIH